MGRKVTNYEAVYLCDDDVFFMSNFLVRFYSGEVKDCIERSLLHGSVIITRLGKWE